jgi:hypothetical protein
MKGPWEEQVTFRIFSEERFKALKPYPDNRKTYSEIRFIFGPNSFFQIQFVLLESTHFEAPDDSENGKWIKMDLTSFSPLTLHILTSKLANGCNRELVQNSDQQRALVSWHCNVPLLYLGLID